MYSLRAMELDYGDNILNSTKPDYPRIGGVQVGKDFIICPSYANPNHISYAMWVGAPFLFQGAEMLVRSLGFYLPKSISKKVLDFNNIPLCGIVHIKQDLPEDMLVIILLACLHEGSFDKTGA